MPLNDELRTPMFEIAHRKEIAMPTDRPVGQNLTSKEIRILWLASLGGALEFYDFVIFVFFTAVIGKLFFPAATSN